MPIIKAFEGIESEDVKKMLNCFQAKTLHFKKETTILSNFANTTQVGIIETGEAEIIRYNYNGTRTILETISAGEIFGSFSATPSEELYVIATKESDVIIFDYYHLINRCKKNCPHHNKLVDNMVQILSNKLANNNERIEVLTKKTIRDKLLAYFNLIAKKQISKNITIPFSLTDLADYLSIDRSAMMREIKSMKEEGLIDSKGKKIFLNY